MDNSIGKKIAELRKQNNLSQKELADKLCVSNKTISKWECGSGNPDIEILIKMAEIFSVTLDELVKNDITIDEKTNKQNEKHFKKKILLVFSIISLCTICIVSSLLCYLYIPRSPKIKSSQVFDINHETQTISCIVNNETDFFSFKDTIETPITTSWHLYYDLDNLVEIKLKTVNLEVGDNSYYIVVENNIGESKVYKVNIRRKPMYTVTFDKGEHYSEENRYIKQLVEEGKSLIIPSEIPFKKGYSFNKWDINYDIVTSNISINAIYSKNVNKIYFLSDKNDISNPIIIEAKTDDTITLPYNSFNKEGYVFSSWKMLDSYTNYNGGDSYVVGNDSDIYFYAAWTPIQYTATLNYNGGIVSQNIIYFTIDSKSIILPETSKENYNFNGWYLDLNDESTKLTSIFTGTSKNLVLYARFTPIEYNINYHLFGGINSSVNPTYTTIESQNCLLQPATHDYLLFQGWYLDKNYENIITEIPEGNIQSIDMYAKWHSALDGTTNNDGYTVIDTIGYFITITQTSTLWSKNFILVSDLDFDNRDLRRIGGYVYGKYPYKGYEGIFNGNGHSLLNFNYTLDKISGYSFTECSLFNIQEGAIKNLHVKGNDIVIDATNIKDNPFFIGGIVSTLGSDASIINCYCETNISLLNYTKSLPEYASFIGGIVGRISGTAVVENCYSTGNFEAENTCIGGIAGGHSYKLEENIAKASIKSCFSIGSITTQYSRGSIVCSGSDWHRNIEIIECYIYSEQIINGRLVDSGLCLTDLLQNLNTDWDSDVWILSETEFPILRKG